MNLGLRGARRWFSMVCWVGLSALLCAQRAAAGELRYLDGHADPIYAVEYTSDGRFLVSAGFDQKVMLWDRATSTLLRTYDDHTDVVLSLAVSNDAAQLATSGLDQQVFLYDLPIPTPWVELASAAESPSALAVSRDGRLVAVAGSAGDVNLWDAAQATRTQAIEFGGNVSRLAFNVDASQVIAAADQVIGGWQTADAATVGRVDLGREIRSLDVHPDNARIAVVDSDGVLRTLAWPPTAPQQIALASPARWLAAAGDLAWIAVASDDGKVRVTPTADPSQARELAAEGAVGVSASRDGTRLSTWDGSGNVACWDVATGQRTMFASVPELVIRDLTLTSDGQYLAAAAADATIRLFRAAGESSWQSQVETESIAVAAIDRSAARIAICVSPSEMRFFNASDGADTETAIVTDEPMTAVAADAGGKSWFVGGENGSIRIVDAATGGTLILPGRAAAVTVLAATRAGDLLAVADAEQRVRIWDTRRGALVRELEASEEPIVSLAYLNQANNLIVATDKSVRLLAADGSVGRSFDVAGGVRSVSCSDDDRWLAVATQEGQLLVYRLEDGRRAAQISAHTGSIEQVDFRPDGDAIATADSEGTVRLWDVATGNLLESHAFAAPLVAVRYAADGRSLIAIGNRGSIASYACRRDGAVRRPRGVRRGVTVHARRLASDFGRRRRHSSRVQCRFRRAQADAG